MNFRVGDRIKYIGDDYLKTHHCCGTDDIGLSGVIVKICSNTVRIYLPKSIHNNNFFSNRNYTWDTQFHRIRLLEGQMLFEFMYDEV